MHKQSVIPVKKKLRLRLTDQAVSLPPKLRSKIDAYWQKRISAQPAMHNGEVFTIIRQAEDQDIIEFDLAQTDYAHFVYSREVGGLGKHAVRVIHPACAILADNQIIFGKMAKHTSLAGVLQMVGGGLDKDAVEPDGSLNIGRTMITELNEEAGLDANDPRVVKSFKPVFLSFEDGEVGKVVLCYVLVLNQTPLEFLKSYQRFAAKLKVAGEQPEFEELVSLPANQPSVEEFIAAHQEKLNPYMPGLLRAVAGYTAVS